MKNRTFFTRTLSFFRPFRKYLLSVVGLMFIGQILTVLSPYLFSKGVDAVISGDIRFTAYFLAIAFAISLFRNHVLDYIREKLELAKLDMNIEKAFSVFSLNKMLDFSIGQHINEHSGVKQSIVNKGQNALTNIMYDGLYNILPNVIQVLVTAGILAFFDWRVSLTALAFILMYVLVAYRSNLAIFPKVEKVRKNNQQQYKLQSELFRNSTLVIAEAQEAVTAADFKKEYDRVADFSISTWTGFIKSFYFNKVIITVGQYATLGLGTYFILLGEHSAGMFVALYSWTSGVFANLISIMQSQRRMLFQVVEVKKYFELLDIEPDINPNIGGKIIEKLEGKIEFKNVSFAYPYRQSAQEIENEEKSQEKEAEHTIAGVDLVIPAGAKVGFVGVSGSGKSTIVNLMRRYYDTTEGEVVIDGVSLKDLDLRWFRSQIGNVEQKIELFDRSIRENILFGLPAGMEVSEGRLQKAVKDASLDEFVAKLKDHGLDTMIGEGGIKVSGGERQRIGIARALIKNPKILIFDEATSALDSINEKLIHDAINRSAQGRTTIIIAHRLSTVMDADVIFVVAGGKIVGQGTHAELEKKNKEYQKLIKNQILMA